MGIQSKQAEMSLSTGPIMSTEILLVSEAEPKLLWEPEQQQKCLSLQRVKRAAVTTIPNVTNGFVKDF